MTWPLVVLAIGSATAGFLSINAAYGGNALFSTFLMLPDLSIYLSHTTEYMLGLLNVMLGLGGMALAYTLYVKEPKFAEKRQQFFSSQSP